MCSNFEFPSGKCEILIDEVLKEKGITFDQSRKLLTTSTKPLWGLIKAYIVPDTNFEPFFPLKLESKTFYVLCKECVTKSVCRGFPTVMIILTTCQCNFYDIFYKGHKFFIKIY